MKKLKSVIITIFGIILLCLILFGIIFVLDKKNTNNVEEFNNVVINSTVNGTVEEDIKKSEVSSESVLETTSSDSITDITIETSSPIRPENETAFKDDSELAEFDYSGFEYWQQNVLNTISKVITNASDSDEVVILSVEDKGDEYYMKAKIKNESQVYYADIDKESMGILNQGKVQ